MTGDGLPGGSDSAEPLTSPCSSPWNRVKDLPRVPLAHCQVRLITEYRGRLAAREAWVYQSDDGEREDGNIHDAPIFPSMRFHIVMI